MRFLSTLHHIVHFRFWPPRGGYAGTRHLDASKENRNIIISAQGEFMAAMETFIKLFMLQKGRLFITVLNKARGGSWSFFLGILNSEIRGLIFHYNLFHLPFFLRVCL